MSLLEMKLNRTISMGILVKTRSGLLQHTRVKESLELMEAWDHVN